MKKALTIFLLIASFAAYGQNPGIRKTFPNSTVETTNKQVFYGFSRLLSANYDSTVTYYPGDRAFYHSKDWQANDTIPACTVVGTACGSAPAVSDLWTCLVCPDDPGGIDLSNYLQIPNISSELPLHFQDFDAMLWRVIDPASPSGGYLQIRIDSLRWATLHHVDSLFSTIGGSGLEYEQFTGDGSTTEFTLSQSVAGKVIVFNEALQAIADTDYSLSDSTVTFTTAPTTGYTITVYWGSGGGSGGGGSGVTSVSSIRETITQATHGLTAGQVARHNGTAWVAARANNAANSEAQGVVESVTDSNTFTIVYAGKINTTAFSLSADTQYYLSAGTAGLLTSAEPSAVGTISKAILRTLTATAAIINIQTGNEN